MKPHNQITRQAPTMCSHAFSIVLVGQNISSFKNLFFIFYSKITISIYHHMVWKGIQPERLNILMKTFAPNYEHLEEICKIWKIFSSFPDKSCGQAYWIILPRKDIKQYFILLLNLWISPGYIYISSLLIIFVGFVF